jgi:hypothetical protein
MRSLLLLLSLLVSVPLYAQGNAGIGTTTPHASALLEVAGFTQGVLTPRMTNAQRNAIVTPATGLLIYQTDATTTESSTFYYYDGMRWIPWGLIGTVWWTTGNSGTSASTNFLGTVDSQALVQRTNNIERLRFYAQRDIAIISGTTAQELRFTEPSGSGTNYTSVEARTQAYDIPWVLPDSQGQARQILTNDGNGNLYWSNLGATMILATKTNSTYSSNIDNMDLEEGKTFFRICATANYNLTGIDGGVDGRFVIVCNVCDGNVQVIQNSANSDPENRILTGGGGTYSLARDEASLFVYDGISLRWRLTAKSP